MQHGADLVAAAGGVLGGEAQAVRLDRGARDRDQPEVLGHQAADAVDVLLLDVEAEQLVEVVDRVARGDPGRAVVELLDLDLLLVVLVGDLADDLLEDVLDRDQAGRAAVLVDDDGDVLALGLHLARAARRRAWSRARTTPGRITSSTRCGELDLGGLEVAADQVLEVGEAEDVVEVLADHRHPREAAAEEQRHRLAQVLVALDVDDVVARHHHLADDGVAELEDGVDHPALAGLDDGRGLGQVDQLAQLGLGRERALAEAAARGDRVADQDQHPRDRAEDAW